jgi:hypothetical protein
MFGLTPVRGCIAKTSPSAEGMTAIVRTGCGVPNGG